MWPPIELLELHAVASEYKVGGNPPMSGIGQNGEDAWEGDGSVNPAMADDSPQFLGLKPLQWAHMAEGTDGTDNLTAGGWRRPSPEYRRYRLRECKFTPPFPKLPQMGKKLSTTKSVEEKVLSEFYASSCNFRQGLCDWTSPWPMLCCSNASYRRLIQNLCPGAS